MKVCHQCKLSFADNAEVCPKCNSPLISVNPPQPVVTDPKDHTSEFTAKDISDNKVFAMLPYLMSWIGIIIALIAAGSSPYAGFHVRQGLKLQICLTLASFCAIVPILGWLFLAVWAGITFVVNIICFFWVCYGKAKEAPIVSEFGFLG